MATKCYTDAEIAAIIAAASGGSAPEIQMLAISDTDRWGNTREMDTTPSPVARLTPSRVGGNLTQNTQLSPSARLALAPTLERYRGAGVDPYLWEKYPGLFEQIPTRQNNTIGPPVGGTTPVLGAPTPGAQPQPTNTTTQAGPPDAIFSPGQPVPSNGGSNMNGFSCPSPSVGTCFSDIPRADINEVVTFPFTDDTANVQIPIDLDNVRGMKLCSLSGLLTVSALDVSTSFYQALLFYGTYTLHFRGQTVPGWTDRPLSEIVADPACCDPALIGVNCLIPEYGGLEVEIDLSGLDLSGAINPVVSLRLSFSGCDCHGSTGCGCGCGGGHPRRVITEPLD